MVRRTGDVWVNDRLDGESVASGHVDKKKSGVAKQLLMRVINGDDDDGDDDAGDDDGEHYDEVGHDEGDDDGIVDDEGEDDAHDDEGDGGWFPYGRSW